MPKFGYWLIEKTTVYKEVEAEDRDQANDIIEDFLESGEMDWWGDRKSTRLNSSH